MPRFTYSLVIATLKDSTSPIEVATQIGVVLGQSNSNNWEVFAIPNLVLTDHQKKHSALVMEFYKSFLTLVQHQIDIKKLESELSEEPMNKDFLNTIREENLEGIRAESFAPFTFTHPASIIAPTIDLAFQAICKKLSPTKEDKIEVIEETEDESFYNQEEDLDPADLKIEETTLGANLRLVSDSSKEINYPIIELTPLQELRKEFVATIFQVGDLADKVLEVIATPILDRLYKQNEKAAMAIPTYAKIEERRRNADGTYILYSEKDGLGKEEEEIQRDIRKSVRKNPWWEPVLVFMTNNPIDNNLRRVQRLFQRINRGWDDRDVWQMDTTMTKSIGAQLIALANTAHGWPGTEEFPHADDWTNVLRHHGHALLNYATNKHEYEGQTYEKMSEAAQEALYWVADHLGHLWD